MLNVDEHKQLLEKRKAIQETLVDTQVKPQRKAVVPTRAIVWALEQGEGTPPENRVPELTKAVDRYIMAMARFNLACSARFNDAAHLAADGQVHKQHPGAAGLANEDHVGSGHQTEPGPAHRPIVLLLGGQMVDPLGAWWKRFRASEEFREMDYLIPTINKDRTGFIPRPGTPDRSLRWLKDALGKQGAPVKDVAELSWYSFRVFMPDWAFQAHIPRDQRQYLGNWFKESTADVYTREKRHVVCSIWDQVLQKLPSMQLEAGRATSDMRTGRTRWSARRRCSRKSSNASWDVIPANKPAITKMAADEVPPPRGPLTVVATTARKGPTKAYSMHLLDTDGVTVGCGWRPGPLKISELAEQDFHAEPEVYLGCTRCFRHFTFPSRGALRSTGLRGLHLPLLGHRQERGHSVGQGGSIQWAHHCPALCRQGRPNFLGQLSSCQLPTPFQHGGGGRHPTVWTKRGPRYAPTQAAAKQGRVVFIGGGPNCRTWSILRHIPKPGAPTRGPSTPGPGRPDST